MRKEIPWLLLPLLRIADAAILDAAAVVQLSQANETATNISGDEMPGAEIIRRQDSGNGLETPTYTSYVTIMETVTAPPQTITSFYSGPGLAGLVASISATTSTAASSMTPTGTCSMPPTVTAPCVISSNGECVRDYYDALQSCYKDGTFSTLKNIAQYVELGDNGSYDGFRDCSQNSLQDQLNNTGTLSRRSLLSDGSVVILENSKDQPLNSQGVAMMDESVSQLMHA
ncbi:hypothetical protein TWF481_008403 [Arthrobotrys musiformis]|uniref:Uncharacterized protein n=1 Tax=Arthrobotrys musiformis TaxID=47236 RepID=A0AAV9WCT3_9PEZI